MKLPTILILENEKDLRDELFETLTDEGFNVLLADRASKLWRLVKHNAIDLFLIDVGIPDESGLTVIRGIRKSSEVGVIILTGKSGEVDRVVGLEVGADDYVTKPFSPRELLARIRAVLRRTNRIIYHAKQEELVQDCVMFDGWTLNIAAYHLVTPDGIEVNLTSTEFELLKLFVECSNRILSRAFLIERVYGTDWEGYDRNMDGLVSRLRKKLKMPTGTPPLIKTIRNAGYIFTSTIT